MTKTNKEPAFASDGFSLISNQKLLALYAAMQGCRMIAERSRREPQEKKSTGIVRSILDHEAAIVGAIIDLQAGDAVAPTLRPSAVLNAINPSVSISSTISLPSRSAIANHDRRNVTVLFSGRGQSFEAWQKALNLASAQSLPILFVSFNRLQRSGWTIDTTGTPPKKRGYAIPSINVDGNDVVVVYRVASEAIAHARKGHGPTLIECMVMHPSDPIQNMKKYLLRKGLLDEQTEGPPNDRVSEWA
jgi:TPP-dependent pyruvate/acetoin dehydrogenase alpha subunit